MFTKKQYVYRNANGASVPTPSSYEDVSLIGAYRDDMPAGSFLYPYKTENNFQDENYHKDIFAICTNNGWKFFQSAPANGNIFKMWRSYPAISVLDNSKIYLARTAYHIDIQTESGPLFMSALGLTNNILSLNVNPFSKAFCRYKGITEDNDIRSYSLCHTEGGFFYWTCNISLLPERQIRADLLAGTLLPEVTKGTIYEKRLFNHEYAYKFFEPKYKLFEYKDGDDVAVNDEVWCQWGEAANTIDSSDINDNDTFRFFELDTLSYINPSNKYTHRNYKFINDENAVSTYMEIYNYSGDASIPQAYYEGTYKLIDILKHETDSNNKIIDTVLNNSENRFLFNIHENEDNNYNINMGDLFRKDDVLTFIFDSCENDEERREIREAILNKFGTKIQITGGKTISVEPIICFMPKMTYLTNESTCYKSILNKCRIEE